MYAAAGEVAAQVAGAPWEELVDRRLVEPLGMERTAPTLAVASTRQNVASPHHRIDDEIRVIENEPVDPVAPAGSYAHPLYDTVEVREEDGGLLLLAGARRTARLEHWHHDTFRAHRDREWQGSTLLTFALDAAGAPARLWVMGLGFERQEE